MLYVVATPIGNLEDITLRALRILREADFIACEDTRVTKKLLSHFKINTLAISYHQHSRLTKIDWIIQQLKSGKSIALVTDAGTPGISDPGNILISECAKNKIKIVPIPGPSALTALASVSGINMQKFIFMAFPPHKKGREKFFKEITAAKYPVIYYESPHRLVKNLELLASFKKNASIIVGRELTKMFEEIIRGTVPEVLNYFQNKDKIKGEFAVIIY
ncbi:16S rRNA (cytidine(1402)-2'-O)-methyltransferase [Patescibacteria group bacterium]|nr:16S rRNA (cytidine(1402)-2'-O)-methyltransferase [Patescibacteria group bacterium]